MVAFKVVAYLAIGLSVLHSVNTKACNCEGVLSVKEALKSSDVVLKGTVLSRTVSLTHEELGLMIKGDATSSDFVKSIPFAVYRMKVDTHFKGGKSYDTVTIVTAVNGAGCGVLFTIGKEWIVYANSVDEAHSTNGAKLFTNKADVFFTNQCTRTTEWSKEEEGLLNNL